MHAPQLENLNQLETPMKVKVNDAQWKGLTESQRKTIDQIVGGNFKGAAISPDAGTPEAGQAAVEGFLGLPNPFCRAACDVAEALAISACASLPPPANAVCIAAAHAAGDACRGGC